MLSLPCLLHRRAVSEPTHRLRILPSERVVLHDDLPLVKVSET